MSAHIVQIGYYDVLLETRRRMLEQAGFRVTSFLGNEDAAKRAPVSMADVDFVLVGFSAPAEVRASAVHFFKTRYATTPVIALLRNEFEEGFAEADAVTVSRSPEVWLSLLKKRQEKSAGSG